MGETITIAGFLGILLPTVVGLLASILFFWKNTDVRLKALEIRVEIYEKNEERVINKLDELQSSVNDIKVTLQNKEDKQ